MPDRAEQGAVLAFAVLAGTWLARAFRRARVRWAPSRATLRHATLAVRTLGDDGPPVVLLHGLAASGRLWGAAFDQLGDRHRLIAPDLLGFGASPRPTAGYWPDDHVAALLACLDELGATQPAVVVGHSMGALIGVHLAAKHPERVAALVGLAPPLYRNRAEAGRRVGRIGFMARILTLDTAVAHRACQWVCEHRDLAARIAELVRPDLPAPVARDSVQHTWASYSGSLRHVLLAATARDELADIRAPVHLVAGARDRIAPPELLQGLAGDGSISTEVWAGSNHDLPLTDPERCVDAITRAIDAAHADGSLHGAA